MDEVEVLTVVVEMAADTLFAIRVPHLNLGVISVLGGQALRDLFVAIEALEGGRAGAELVAARALCSPRQGLMCFRKRAGRNLRVSGRFPEPPEKAEECAHTDS